MFEKTSKDIKLKVIAERFDTIFSIEEWIGFARLTNTQIYEKMLQFVVNEEGEYLTTEQARALFSRLPKKEWGECLLAFTRAVRDAFVSPTNGGG